MSLSFAVHVNFSRCDEVVLFFSCQIKEEGGVVVVSQGKKKKYEQGKDFGEKDQRSTEGFLPANRRAP